MSFGLMFHHFHGAGHPRVQGSISASDLVDIVDYVGRDNILPANEWLSRFANNSLGEKNCCLTFDDTLKCQFDVALPVLREFELTAIWFISTSILEKQNSLEVFRFFRTVYFEDIDDFYEKFFDFSTEQEGVQIEVVQKDPLFSSYLKEFDLYTENDRIFRFIRDIMLGPSKYEALMWKMMVFYKTDIDEIKKNLWMDDFHIKQLCHEGHVIGLHSHSHPTDMKSFSRQEQYEDYMENRQKLEDLIGYQPTTASHPCNSYNNDTLEVLSELGVQFAFRANMQAGNHKPALEIPREDHANIMRRING